ncbi:MAG: oxidoreductase [Anaerolinea sp.]|nr:oxidoreductase [Anaerolinea sp.]
MRFPIFQVDAFTDKLFQGNPAAVVLLDGPQDPVWMQLVAREMNLSETAFAYPQTGGYRLQWFTPETEVDLCGHATLATAHILWEMERVNTTERIRFSTRSGWLSAEKKEEIIELDLPSAPLILGEVSEEIIKALGPVPDFVGISGEKWLLEYHDERVVRNMKPDFSALRERSGRGLIVTAISDKPGIDFVSRYFAPWVGINEDPVTGSAHCILGPYWGAKLRKNHMTAYQASSRGGIVHIRLSAERTYVGGKAITVFAGELFG